MRFTEPVHLRVLEQLDRPAPMSSAAEREQRSSVLAQRSAALDALMALGCDYITAARAVASCARQAELPRRERD